MWRGESKGSWWRRLDRDITEDIATKHTNKVEADGRTIRSHKAVSAQITDVVGGGGFRMVKCPRCEIELHSVVYDRHAAKCDRQVWSSQFLLVVMHGSGSLPLFRLPGERGRERPECCRRNEFNRWTWLLWHQELLHQLHARSSCSGCYQNEG